MTLWEETIASDPFCKEVHELRTKLAQMLAKTPETCAISDSLIAAINGLDTFTGFSETSCYVGPKAKKSATQ